MELNPDTEALFARIVDGICEDGYAVVDGFVHADEAALLLSELIAARVAGKLHRAGIGQGTELQQNAGIRGDEIMWLEAEPQPATTAFVARLEALISYFNRAVFAGVKDYEAHFAAYPPGAYYKRHLDQFRNKGSRRFTFILYLNPTWDAAHGGELRMYLPAGAEAETALDVPPLAGRMVCFRSEMFEHEVLPTTVMRYSITGWWLDKAKNLEFLQ